MNWAELKDWERNKLIGEKIMEWTVVEGHSDFCKRENCLNREERFGIKKADGCFSFGKTEAEAWDQSMPRFWERIEDAWEIVRKMREDGYFFEIIENIWKNVEVYFMKPYAQWPRPYASESNAVEAICKAALKAKGVDIE